ncbi:hypothetical protein EKH55_0043 [Sinorhizobium alkalisoli]|nr:hypothetical protein EKH55_0043 [Sinorhizobium alkalisoli]
MAAAVAGQATVFLKNCRQSIRFFPRGFPAADWSVNGKTGR